MDIFITEPSNTYTIMLSKEELTQLNAGKSVMLEPTKTPSCFHDYLGQTVYSDHHMVYCRDLSGERGIQFLTIKVNNKEEN